jgi:magnesium chelatase family protein
LAQEQGVLSARPFREPHHSATSEGILGGGPHLGPGEISLAHNGVLFLDEAPEFSPRLLQALREPLESGQIQVVRAGRSVWYPSRFLLVMTANGCPCGQTGREKGTCFCGSQSVRRYWDRIGTALLDRVDLRVFVTPASGALQESAPTWSEVRSPILGAVQRQRKRGQSPGESNASLGFERLRQLCPIPLAAWNLATAWGIREDWSTRGLQAVVKVALTLADLENSPVTPAHIEAAAGLRKPSGGEPWSA